jgi:1,4-alpha-glucan branching enzyme
VTRSARGRLAVVLHTHMPYVEGFGTWPFGEEWLWEAVATSYVPLLGLLERGAPLTLSLTPVLCDQLEAPGALDRCRAFLAGVRPESHRLDAEAARADGDEEVAAELERAAGDYARALDRLPADLLGALRPYAAWTSSATHAVLPLLATDASVRLQVRSGVAAHRARFGAWRGGFWLPECAYASRLDPLLEEAGVHAVCVDLTDVLGRGDERQLRPIATAGGPLLVPVDRATVELVWSDGGYPAHGAYRDYHRRTPRDRNPWANDGAVYDPERAAAQARADATDFVARVRERVAGGGLAVFAADTELLGHWWHEGPIWLEAVLDAAARDGLEIVALDDALADGDAAPPLDVDPDATTTWGTPRDLATWSAPPSSDLAWTARDAELRVACAGAAAPDRALRELLALQSSDWAFLQSRGLAGDYPTERAAAHLAALEAALADRDGAGDELRNLAPHLCRAAFLEP